MLKNFSFNDLLIECIKCSFFRNYPMSTPAAMRSTLAAGRLVKFLVEMWQLDEQEKVNRKYVDGTDAEITILPESWLISSN